MAQPRQGAQSALHTGRVGIPHVVKNESYRNGTINYKMEFMVNVADIDQHFRLRLTTVPVPSAWDDALIAAVMEEPDADRVHPRRVLNPAELEPNVRAYAGKLIACQACIDPHLTTFQLSTGLNDQFERSRQFARAHARVCATHATWRAAIAGGNPAAVQAASDALEDAWTALADIQATLIRDPDNGLNEYATTGPVGDRRRLNREELAVDYPPRYRAVLHWRLMREPPAAAA